MSTIKPESLESNQAYSWIEEELTQLNKKREKALRLMDEYRERQWEDKDDK